MTEKVAKNNDFYKIVFINNINNFPKYLCTNSHVCLNEEHVKLLINVLGWPNVISFNADDYYVESLVLWIINEFKKKKKPINFTINGLKKDSRSSNYLKDYDSFCKSSAPVKYKLKVISVYSLYYFINGGFKIKKDHLAKDVPEINDEIICATDIEFVDIVEKYGWPYAIEFATDSSNAIDIAFIITRKFKELGRKINITFTTSINNEIEHAAIRIVDRYNSEILELSINKT